MTDPTPQESTAPDAPPDAEARSIEELAAALGPDFEIIRRLGKGAMANVFLARDRGLGVLVAVKVLRPGKAADETARRRFEREARSAATLSEHPNVVPVTRFGRLPDETPYLVMRYVKGRTMEERLKAEGKLSVAQAREVLRSVASALALAHGKGIVHRDIRPGNVLWDEERNRALLSDFGIAAVLATGGEEVTRLTRTGQLLGDTRYMSPEQLLDKDLTELADIYQLGVLGYELLTGEGPYEVRSNAEWITAHLTREPRDLLAARPDAGPALADLLRRCLAKEANHRPSATDVARALEDGAAPGAALADGGEAPDLSGLIKRRVPQIVLVTAAAGWGLIQVVDQFSQHDLVAAVVYPLTLAFAAAAVLTSTVIAWFHGAKGKQRAPAVEYVLLGLIVIAWAGVSAWIFLGRRP
jgi:serine/threonine protein kinase